MNLLKKSMLFVCLGFIIIGSNNCIAKFPSYPNSQPCLFSISSPSDFNCFKNFSATGGKIRLKINLVIKYIKSTSTGPVEEVFDDQSITSDPTFPIYLTANIPANTPSTVWVYVQGDECSTCANNHSENNETPYGPCPFTQVTTNPATYRAALPRWFGIRSIQAGASSGMNLSGMPRITNVPNSCGCTVGI